MHRRLLTLALLTLFAAPAASFAASATQDGYDEVAVQAETASGAAPDSETAPMSETSPTATAEASPTTVSSSNLPFTGLEAGLIAAAGFGLAGTGVALRRAARQQ